MNITKAHLQDELEKEHNIPFKSINLFKLFNNNKNQKNRY